MDVARDGAARRRARCCRQQRLPRRRGLLRLRRAGRAARATPTGAQAARDAGVAVLYVHALNPYGFSWWRRITHENVDLNRNFHDFSSSRCRATPPTTSSRALLRARDLAADAATVDADRALRRRARRQGLAGGDLGRPVPPSATASSTAATRRPGASTTLRQVLRDHGTRCAGSAWIDLHTGLGPNGHGERIFACRDDAAAYARAKRLVGRRSPRSTTARRPRPCSPA